MNAKYVLVQEKFTVQIVNNICAMIVITEFIGEAVIEATINGKDSLVTCPTGSGKSLCFQFPPIYKNKKAIIVTQPLVLCMTRSKN